MKIVATAFLLRFLFPIRLTAATIPRVVRAAEKSVVDRLKKRAAE